jgi:hypothetical protein
MSLSTAAATMPLPSPSTAAAVHKDEYYDDNDCHCHHCRHHRHHRHHHCIVVASLPTAAATTPLPLPLLAATAIDNKRYQCATAIAAVSLVSLPIGMEQQHQN